jgi:hypothetical protein
VCIDPISSYLGKVDSHKNAELRAVLEPVPTRLSRSRRSGWAREAYAGLAYRRGVVLLS